MAINALDHVNIRTSLMVESLAFYGEMLGMTVTVPPGMDDISDNAWIVADDGRPVVHLNRVLEGSDFLGDDRDWSVLRGSARVHHVAFDCADYDAFRARLAGAGLALRFNDVTAINLRQIFVHDPNDILIELNFR
jgi:catechol 2,3-dioxygenase-like lactoylglutathione lyase family enzyme